MNTHAYHFRETFVKSSKIAPMTNSKSTALYVLSSPEANLYYENCNADLKFESEKVKQMDNIAQFYTDEEDPMITSGLGLIAGIEMKGAIPFRNFLRLSARHKISKASSTRRKAIFTICRNSLSGASTAGWPHA